ncbi:protein phosphatase 1 regulatory subunit 3C-like [Brienomyrus brachyistius]|uniref:protein phosphatase 1 regulatory subunit 3C-like n=1 Tax=Brienomyrus brachyistius TaxID=42636 RepID=UPI0020B26F43|nr:protein phosphatase 1 regulatory subunit 3C-like [Brienomyrus brachyistius]
MLEVPSLGENLRKSQLPPKELLVSGIHQVLPTMGKEQMQPAAGTACSVAKKRRVVFADSKGLALTAVCVFTAEEAIPYPKLTLRSRQPVTLKQAPPTGCTGHDRGSWGKRRVRLGFPQPSSDFQSFRAQLQGALVALESCTVTGLTLSGTVLVKNVSYEKDVRLRITFDSWRSHRDMPCVYLYQGYYAPDTDTFTFSVPLPDSLDPQDRLEFCVSYLPGGYDTPLWDNNRGQNFRIHVDPESVDPSSEPSRAPPTVACALRHFGVSQPWSWRPGSDYLTLPHSFSCPDLLMGHCWDILGNTAPF